MAWYFSDGGRRKAGFIGETRDCAARALAIAENMSYTEAYKLMAQEKTALKVV